MACARQQPESQPRTPRVAKLASLGRDVNASLSPRLRLGSSPTFTSAPTRPIPTALPSTCFKLPKSWDYATGWAAQHHFLNGGGRMPSTLTFLAAAAERTRRIGLGTAILILPLEDPLRVAEDAAVVDTLSGGRLQLGQGTAATR